MDIALQAENLDGTELTSDCAGLTIPDKSLTFWLQRRNAMLDAAQPALPFKDPLPATLAPRQAKRKVSCFPVLDRPASPAEMRAMRQAFMGLVRRWALTGEEALQLLGEPFDDASAREQRLNALLGVNRSLLLVLPEGDACLCFLRRPCQAFAGASVLQVMLADGLPGIERVREYLARAAAQPGTLDLR